MKRIVRQLIAAVFAIGIALVIPTSAQAQMINCSAHVLDATTAQDIYTPMINRAVDALTAISPSADVYVQAYDQLPPESLYEDAFTGLCTNWRDATGERVKDNVMIVVYDRYMDSVRVFYGYDFEAGISKLAQDTSQNGINANLGPSLSGIDANYATEAMVQAVSDARLSLEKSNYFSGGTYHPPAYVDPNSSASGEVDWNEVVAMIIKVAVGFAAFGLVCWIFGSSVRVLRRKRSS